MAASVRFPPFPDIGGLAAFDPLRTLRSPRYRGRMSGPTEGSTEPSRFGCVIAVALVFVPAVAVSLLSGPLPGEEWLFALFFGLLLALPFAYLGLSGTRDWLPWIVVIVLTALFWGAFTTSVILSARSQTGVNMAMGLVMLAAPFVTTMGAWIANRRY